MLNVSVPYSPQAPAPIETSSDKMFKVAVASHHFKVTPLTDMAKKLCYEFSKRYAVVEDQGGEVKITAYAAADVHRKWFRFHINTFKDWKNFLYQRSFNNAVEYITRPMYEPTKVKLAIQDGWVHKPHQEPVRDYLAQPVGIPDEESGIYPDGTGSPRRMVGLETGGGKTFVALAELAMRGELFVIIVLSQYVGKWVDDIAKTLKVGKKEILAVKGGNSLQALTHMAVTKGSMKPYKAIIISNRTYENYLRAYERHENDLESFGYMCTPDEIFEKLGVGTRLVDEVHMQFYANFRLDLYTHVPRAISLSATLFSKDPVKERIHQVAYPKTERYNAPPPKKYTDAFAVRYSVNPQWRYKTSYKEPNYSQNAYEESILKNKDFTNSYFKMIKSYLHRGYVNSYEPGNKAVLFCGTVDMCGKLAEYLQKSYPQYTVKRYVAEDPYKENYLEPDIRVTTIGSGGTGHDVPGLTDNHLTPGLDSIQANVQVLGRLREIPGKQTRFFWYTNTDVPKHIKYDRSKMELMRERAKSCTPLSYGELN